MTDILRRIDTKMEEICRSVLHEAAGDLGEGITEGVYELELLALAAMRNLEPKFTAGKLTYRNINFMVKDILLQFLSLAVQSKLVNDEEKKQVKAFMAMLRKPKKKKVEDSDDE